MSIETLREALKEPGVACTRTAFSASSISGQADRSGATRNRTWRRSTICAQWREGSSRTALPGPPIFAGPSYI